MSSVLVTSISYPSFKINFGCGCMQVQIIPEFSFWSPSVDTFWVTYYWHASQHFDFSSTLQASQFYLKIVCRFSRIRYEISVSSWYFL